MTLRSTEREEFYLIDSCESGMREPPVVMRHVVYGGYVCCSFYHGDGKCMNCLLGDERIVKNQSLRISMYLIVPLSEFEFKLIIYLSRYLNYWSLKILKFKMSSKNIY